MYVPAVSVARHTSSPRLASRPLAPTYCALSCLWRGIFPPSEFRGIYLPVCVPTPCIYLSICPVKIGGVHYEPRRIVAVLWFSGVYTTSAEGKLHGTGSYVLCSRVNVVRNRVVLFSIFVRVSCWRAGGVRAVCGSGLHLCGDGGTPSRYGMSCHGIYRT